MQSRSPHLRTRWAHAALVMPLTLLLAPVASAQDPEPQGEAAESADRQVTRPAEREVRPPEPDAEPEPPAAEPDPLVIPIGTTTAGEEIEALKNRIRALEEQFDALQAEDVIDESDIPLDLETKVHGYADVSLRAYRLLQPVENAAGEVVQLSNHPPGFEIGDLVISYNANLDRRVYATIDLVYGLGHFGEQLALVDRIDLRFEVSNALKITAGKFQSPFGYWNTNIPYGSYLYAPSQRPYMLTFERHGSWLTTRQTGIDLHGELNAGFWRWGYHAGVGNGRSAQLAKTQDIGDGTAYKTTWAQLWLESPGGFQLGFTGMYDPLRQERTTEDFNQDLGDQSDRVHENSDPRNPVLSSNADEYLLMPHIAWRTTNMEVLVEGALLLRRAEPDKPLEMNRAGYVQWSHRFGDWTPYARGEFVEWWKDDPVWLDLAKLKTRAQGTLGVRWDIALHAALKFEGTYIYETVYKHPDDPTFVHPHMDKDIYMPGINENYVDRIGGSMTLAVGF